MAMLLLPLTALDVGPISGCCGLCNVRCTYQIVVTPGPCAHATGPILPTPGQVLQCLGFQTPLGLMCSHPNCPSHKNSVSLK